MAIKKIKLAKFQQNIAIVDGEGKLTRSAQTALNDAFDQIQEALNGILQIPEIQAALIALDAATAAAQAAADNANASADENRAATALANSYVEPNPLSAEDAGTNATIDIAAHTRVYGDGTSVSVLGGTVTGLAYETAYYVYYDQPSRTGGSVTYLTTEDYTVASQTGDRHVVGLILTPATGGTPVDGDPVLPPGAGTIRRENSAL